MSEKLPRPALFEDEECEKCLERIRQSGWNAVDDFIDLAIYHNNNHVWPGFAGEPDGGNYGGSDF